MLYDMILFNYMLPKKDKYWVIELKIPLNDILLYISNGYDEEFIINEDYANNNSILLKQT